jgi:inorganic pyrophosphatase
LRVDRPQLYSNICPSLYGLIPQTYCGERVAEYCKDKTGRENIEGDHDPLDICVLTEKLVPTGNVLVTCKPIGGFRMIDGGEADDKIIAVMNTDAVYSKITDISQVPESVINRLKHYFLTYKQSPDNPIPKCEITHVYGREEAFEVIERSVADYDEKFPGLREIVNSFKI